MQKAGSVFLSILRSHLDSQPLSLSEPIPWDGVLELAKAHNLTAMVSFALREYPAVPESVAASLRGGFHAALFMDVQRSHIRELLSAQLESAGIDHVFLRGICLRDAYPVPALRTMGDMDVLVKMEDYAAIHRVLTAMGASPSEEDDNHRSYSFPSGVCVEFHPNLLRHTSLGAAINPGWQFVSPGSRRLSPEGEYLNLVCHLAHHFCEGGTGVRSVMDVWVARHRLPQPDRQRIDPVLEGCGLLEFVQNIEALSEAWFGEGEWTPVLKSLAAYILTSGVYGTRERMLLSAAAFSGSKWSSLRAKVFPPKAILEDTCPWSKGKPLLLPAAWVCRLVSKTTRENGGVLNRWGKENLSITDEAVQQQKSLLRSFGFHIPN